MEQHIRLFADKKSFRTKQTAIRKGYIVIEIKRFP